MNPKEARQAWVAKLRSGEVKQGRCQLAPSEDSRCCLGLACDLYIEEGGALERFDASRADRRLAYRAPDGVIYVHLLPPEVASWLGLTNESGGYYQPNRVRALSELNDQGCSFDEIADVIEREPMGLVTDADS